MIRRCASLLTPSSVVQVVQALVLSHLDYCPVLWSNADKKDIIKLQVAENKAARLALGYNYYSRAPTKPMYERQLWLTVEQKVATSLVSLVRNICTNKKPNCLHRRLHFTRDRHTYSTRNAVMGRFTTPKPNTDAMRGSVMYRAMSMWNALPYEITVTEGKQSFNRKVKTHFSRILLG